jgi:hypothetical protein
MSRSLALVLGLAACGRELHHGVDAPPPDVPIDMAEIVDNGEPPVDAVKLTMTRLGAPVIGTTVIFQRLDGTLVQTSLTDPTGRAWALMPDGGYVTAIEHIGTDLDELTTFTTVAPGDSLRLDSTPIETGTSGIRDVSVPPTAPVADGYTVQTSCGNGGADILGAGVVNLESCGTMIDVVVLSLTDGIPNGYALYAPDVPLPASGTIAITGTFAMMTTVSLSYTGVPAETSAVLGYQALSATRRAYQTSSSGPATAGSAQVDLQMPVHSSTVLTVSTLYPMSGEVAQQIVYDWGDASTNKSINLATALMPAYSTEPTFDISSRAVTWTERAGGTAPDAMLAKLQLHRDDLPAGHAWRWQLAGARGSGPSITLPMLPAINNFDFNPKSGDSVAVTELVGMRLPGGLAPWRSTIFAPVGHVVTGTSGTISLQMLWEEQM